MLSELRKRPRALLISLGLHVVVIVALIINFQFFDEPNQIKQGEIATTVKAEIINQEQLEALEKAKKKVDTRHKQEADKKKKDLEARKRADRKKKEADKKRKAEAKKKADIKRNKEAEEKRKQKQTRAAADKKKADQKRKAEEAKAAEERRKAAEAKAAEEARVAEVKRIAEEARREEEERIRQEAEQRRLAEEEQKRKQADLKARLLAEENQRRLNSLREAYKLAIRQKVERKWQKPAGSGKMPICEVHVVQGPGGIILDVTFGACGGSTATYRASIENAVYRADPLPKPGDAALFERELTFLFNPNE